MQNTKWNQTVEVETPELPESFWELPGVTPVVGTVNEEIGDEVMLLINDPTEGAESLGNITTFELNVGSGSIDTEHGSLGFILFIVPDQENPGQPHAVWEILFDPANPEMTEPFERLAAALAVAVLAGGAGKQVERRSTAE